MPELVILIGLPGAGKTTFFRQRFGESHAHVSKDNLRNNRQPARRQSELIDAALGAGRSVVVDNTNATVEERGALIAQARRHGARVAAYFFDCTKADCIARNAGRQGRARVPNVGIFTIAKRLIPPARAEGFDELHTVRPLPGEQFQVQPA